LIFGWLILVHMSVLQVTYFIESALRNTAFSSVELLLEAGLR